MRAVAAGLSPPETGPSDGIWQSTAC